MESKNVRVTRKALKRMFDDADLDSSKTIDFDEFLSAMKLAPDHTLTDEWGVLYKQYLAEIEATEKAASEALKRKGEASEKSGRSAKKQKA
mmetsp:Transcript_47081/g.75650  ORF Transcript_47081/g.75650 Transcript_47081/m.75650 type:complete len:91 (+) Transcript_47081:314-586(+)